MEHDPVGALEARADAPERHCGVEQHEVGVDARRQLVDLADEAARGQHHLACHPFDADRLHRVERRRTVERGGQNGRVFWRQPAPQLPQVGLDAADLRWEVVGDQ